ncbi:MAG: undecaprenyl-diphosphate phosphatase [Anaerolineae bacterium]|nr:undecaprenyl-diphosphate phosphatase [Anaerolineae bacterium]
MTLFQAFLLGLLQGATEFIPVSSSGHLTLVPWLLNWTFDPVLKGAFDVLAHWGTLVAVLAVFWRDLWALFLGGLRTLGGLKKGARGVIRCAQNDVQGRLAWLLVIGSIPAAVLGLLLEDFFESLFGTPRTVSILLIVTAGLLAFSEWRGHKGRAMESLTWLDALLIGLGQAVAIAPGISRSGATMASGLLRGVKRDAAARFSFLLSTPVIVGAGVWQLKDLFESSGWTASLLSLLVGFAVAAIAGYACIRFLLNYLRKGRLYVFSIYCALAGLAGLIISFVR